MAVRVGRSLGAAVLAVVAVGAAGCGDASTQPNGAWTGCGNVARPSVVQVRRSVPPARSVSGVLLATERRAGVARRLYDDMCVIAGHPPHLPPNAVLNCPADFGLMYRGVFYLRRQTLAVFTYAASGCNALSLSVGGDQANTLICCNKIALVAQPSLDAGLAAMFGVQAGTIHQRTFPRHKPPNVVELRQFFEGLGAVQCMRLHGYPRWLGSIQGDNVPGLDMGSPRLQAMARACGVSP